MGNITKKVIKKLLKDIRDDLEESIAVEGERQINAGASIIDMKVILQMSETEIPPPIEVEGLKAIEFANCFWICYDINGVRICKKYCY